MFQFPLGRILNAFADNSFSVEGMVFLLWWLLCVLCIMPACGFQEEEFGDELKTRHQSPLQS